MANVCKGGCGKELPPTNKSGYAWGHANGCPAELLTPPVPEGAAEEAEADAAVDEAAAVVECLLSERQLDAIWAKLPVNFKAAAVMYALDCEE